MSTPAEREELESPLGPGLANLLRTCPIPDPDKKVCTACGAVHYSAFRDCQPCRDAMNRGE